MVRRKANLIRSYFRAQELLMKTKRLRATIKKYGGTKHKPQDYVPGVSAAKLAYLCPSDSRICVPLSTVTRVSVCHSRL